MFLYLYTCKQRVTNKHPLPTPMTNTNLIKIFCIFDNYCKYFTPELKKHMLQVPDKRLCTDIAAYLALLPQRLCSDRISFLFIASFQ